MTIRPARCLRNPTKKSAGQYLNQDSGAPHGIERHAELLGPAYARMGAERGQDDPWTPDLVARVARVAAEVHEILPPGDWAAHVDRRDRALMRLEQARRADPESFTGFTRADPADRGPGRR
jgi:hypothetical protein